MKNIFITLVSLLVLAGCKPQETALDRSVRPGASEPKELKIGDNPGTMFC